MYINMMYLWVPSVCSEALGAPGRAKLRRNSACASARYANFSTDGIIL